MRIKDALGTLVRTKEKRTLKNLVTEWTERADDPAGIPLAEYPRPQLQRKDWICLNGWWEYAFTRKNEKYRAPEGKILVPFSPETARSGVGRSLTPGRALWYRKVFSIEEMKPGFRLMLHFGAVDERCTVWCGGKMLGRHRCGYLPFSFDITGAVSEGDNELLVRVLDDTDRGPACRGKQRLKPGGMFYTAQSGIWQTVFLEWVPDVYIRKIKITPDLSRKEVKIRILANAPAGGTVSIGSPGIFRERPVSMGEAEQVFHFTEEEFDKRGGVTCTVKMQDPVCWSPESPMLYPLRIRLGEDEVTSYFAMRSFGKGKNAAGYPCLLLNGEPYFFHGVLDQGYWPESLMTAPADEALVFDILKMKELGFNMLRKHIKVEPLRWYYHCDRIGMVVWQDMVSGGGPLNSLLCTYMPTVIPKFGGQLSDRHYRLLSRENVKERERYRKQLLEMIDLLENEPCIGLWVIFNEGWGQFDSVRLTGTVRKVDPTRLIDHASGWFDQGAGDVRSIHNYYQKMVVHKDPYGRPFVLSEYGGSACCIPGHFSAERPYGYHNETPESFSGNFRQLMEKIREMSREGLVAAVYTQLSDIEEEVNGLLTYDRKCCKVDNS